MKLAATLLAFAVTATSAQTTKIKLWPHAIPDVQTTHSSEKFRSSAENISDITNPLMIVYPPASSVPNTGAAVLVFPGGGYQMLGIVKAGTEPCEYIASLGITCFLVEYRVPLRGHYPEQKAMIEDGQQAVRLVRSQAAAYKIDPDNIGALGGSAGANLVAILSTHPDDDRTLATPAAAEVPMTNGKPVSAKLNFAILCWPAYLYNYDGDDPWTLDPTYKPNQFTPRTFIIQAENDDKHGPNSLDYYAALMKAKIPAELHMYATGGHGFGLHPSSYGQAHWTDLLTNWLRYNKIIPGWVAETDHRTKRTN
jgi:acetyl esterase/lipase